MSAAPRSRESCRAGKCGTLRQFAPFRLPGHLGGASPVSVARPGRGGRARGPLLGDNSSSVPLVFQAPPNPTRGSNMVAAKKTVSGSEPGRAHVAAAGRAGSAAGVARVGAAVRGAVRRSVPGMGWGPGHSRRRQSLSSKLGPWPPRTGPSRALRLPPTGDFVFGSLLCSIPGYSRDPGAG